MPDFAQKTVVFTVILASLSLPSFSACRMYESTWEDYKTIVLENELVKVVLMPESNGRISEYTFKPTRTNQFPKLVLNEFSVDTDLKLSTSNYAGYEDWIWELGASSGSSKYNWKTLENTKDKSSVQLTREGIYRISRTVTLKSGSSALDIAVTIKNLTDTDKTYSYWSHLMTNPGGGQDIRDIKLFAPITKNSGRIRNIDLVKSEKETIYSRTYKSDAANTFIMPSQDWWGISDRKRDITIFELVPKEELARDGFLYNHSREDFTYFEKGYSMSMETIYSSTTFKPQDQREYHMTIAACRGLGNILYADENIAIGANTVPLTASSKRAVVKLNAGAFTIRNGLAAEVRLVGKDGKTVAKTRVKLPRLGPESAVPVTLEFGKVPEGEYTLTWQVAGASFGNFNMLSPVVVK